MADKANFILHLDQYEPIKSFSLEQKGMLLDSFFVFHLGQEVSFDDPAVAVAFSFFKIEFERKRTSDRFVDISQSEWKKLRITIFERDNYTCLYCGRKVDHPHCDHILPFSRGGESVPENLATACPACNREKWDRTPEEWL